MIATTIDQELARAINNLNKVSKVAVPNASRRAINIVSRKVVTLSTREIAKNTKVPKKLVDRQVKMLKANRAHKHSKIRINREGISAIRLPNVQVQFKRRKGQMVRGSGRIRAGRHTFDNAFIAQMQNGPWHIAQRKGKARLPIDVIKIPIKDAATQAFEKNTTTAMKSTLPAQLKIELTKELNRVLK
jgi:hypothetical protein